MESDDPIPSVPRKRSRSQSVDPAVASPVPIIDGASSAAPPSKRQKKVPPTYDTADHERLTVGLAGHNPLNRKALKKDAKRARKAERKASRGRAPNGGGMEVDDEGCGLAFTFMASVDGIAQS